MKKVAGLLVALAIFCAVPAVAAAGGDGDFPRDPGGDGDFPGLHPFSWSRGAG